MYHQYIFLSKQYSFEKQTIFYSETIQETADCSDTPTLDRIILYEGLKKLTKKQRKIIILYYYYGYNDQYIGERLLISHQEVNRHRQVALVKLKNFFKETKRKTPEMDVFLFFNICFSIPIVTY